MSKHYKIKRSGFLFEPYKATKIGAIFGKVTMPDGRTYRGWFGINEIYIVETTNEN